MYHFLSQLRSELASKEAEIEKLKLTLKTHDVEKNAEASEVNKAAGKMQNFVE